MTEFSCKVGKRFRSACEDLPEYQGTGYCVLHFPGDKNQNAFEKAFRYKAQGYYAQRKNYDFGGTVFPGDFRWWDEFNANVTFSGATFRGFASFWKAKFKGEQTDFSGAEFCDVASFSEAEFSSSSTNFTSVKFGGAFTSFGKAKFSGMVTRFGGAEFNAELFTDLGCQYNSTRLTSFSGAKFSGPTTNFSEANFSSSSTDFSETVFGSAETTFRGNRGNATFAKEVRFNKATFEERVTFEGTTANPVFGPQSWVQFNHPRLEKPELLRFYAVLLHPGWFINVDIRKVDFTDVKWYGMSGGLKGTLEEEISLRASVNRRVPYVSSDDTKAFLSH